MVFKSEINVSSNNLQFETPYNSECQFWDVVYQALSEKLGEMPDNNRIPFWGEYFFSKKNQLRIILISLGFLFYLKNLF